MTPAEIIAKARAAHAARQIKPTVAVATPPAPVAAPALHGKVFLNAEQQAAFTAAQAGKSIVLIGAAGTGKTTVTQQIIQSLAQANHIAPFPFATKHIPAGAPGILVVGFTNKAVNNIKKKLPPELQQHCITIHKTLEYGPEFYEVIDNDGNVKSTMRFEPHRHAINPLPAVSCVIWEESSMIGTDLYSLVLDALPNQAQHIFLGDIFQLPPVFGPSILGFKMAEIEVIELKHVYRQALESPIISLATAVRLNQAENLPKNLTEITIDDRGVHGKVTLHPWKKRLPVAAALPTAAKHVIKMIDAGKHDPATDKVLIPYNKSFGTVEFNKYIATHLSQKRGALVHEVIARYTKSYWAVGDHILHDRHEGTILDIYPTPGYVGRPFVEPSTKMDRWGNIDGKPADGATFEEILNTLEAGEGTEDAKNLASHTIELYLPDLDEKVKINTAGEINNLKFSYALTVHKSQGSEWRRVIVLLHNSHSSNIYRELLYTAFTRAREELYIICEGDIKPYTNQISLGAERASIPGITLEEKIEYFKGKKAAMQSTE